MARRLRLTPAPGRDEIVPRTVHEVVRDYPEALAALRFAGVDPARDGGRRLGELGSERGAVQAVLEATTWRPAPPTTPSTGKMGGAGGASMGERDAPPARSADVP